MIQSFFFLNRLTILIIVTIIGITAHSQYRPDKELLIISCKTGTLLIDGVEIGRIEAEDAVKQKLGYGEHYLQLKAGTEKINQTVIVDSLTKSIIRIGCEPAASNNNQLSTGKRLFEKQINLTGLIAMETDENLFALDNGDEIILNCDVLNKKGSVNIMIQEYDKKTVLFHKERVNIVTNERISVPSRGVYQLTLQTQALLGKDVQVSVDRIPGINSRPDFNTVVKKIYDTTSNEFLTTRGRVYSRTNSHPNKTLIPIQLPPNTNYWVYWIGLGEQSSNEIKKMAETLSSLSQAISPNPLVHFGLKLIPSLPMLNTPSTINYFFTDNRNANAFLRDQASGTFTDLPGGNHISNAYSLINRSKTDLVLVLSNESSFTGVDIEVRAVAFTIKPRFIIQE